MNNYTWAAKLDCDIQCQINKVAAEQSGNQPLDGYYNARENKRRRQLSARLGQQIEALQSARTALQRYAEMEEDLDPTRSD